jgi:ferredoxin
LAKISISCLNGESKEEYSIELDSKDTLKPENSTDGAPTLMDLLINNDVPVGSSCGGHGMCHWCKLSVVQGDELLSDLSNSELEAQERGSMKDDQRLSCQVSFESIKDDQKLVLTAAYW